MANIRDVLNNNSSIVTIAAVLALISALTYIIYSSTNGSRRGGVVSQWYFDENTGQLFAVKGHQYPPIQAPSDSDDSGVLSGVRAHVFACGECEPDLEGQTLQELYDKGVTVAYLEKYTDEAKDHFEQATSEGGGGPGPGGLGGPPGMGGHPGMGGPPGMMDPGMMMMEPWMNWGRLIRMLEQDEWIDPASPYGQQITMQVRNLCPKGDETQRLRGCRPGKR